MLALPSASGTAVASTPRQLYNKTIQLSWSLNTVQRRPDGRIVSPRIDVERTIYVSTAGRLFVRTTKTVNNRSKTGEMDGAIHEVVSVKVLSPTCSGGERVRWTLAVLTKAPSSSAHHGAKQTIHRSLERRCEARGRPTGPNRSGAGF